MGNSVSNKVKAKTVNSVSISKNNNNDWLYVDDYLCCNEFFLKYVIYNSGISFPVFCKNLLKKLNEYSSTKIRKKRKYSMNTTIDKILNIIWLLGKKGIHHHCRRHSNFDNNSIVNEQIVDDLIYFYKQIGLI